MITIENDIQPDLYSNIRLNADTKLLFDFNKYIIQVLDNKQFFFLSPYIEFYEQSLLYEQALVIYNEDFTSVVVFKERIKVIKTNDVNDDELLLY